MSSITSVKLSPSIKSVTDRSVDSDMVVSSIDIPQRQSAALRKTDLLVRTVVQATVDKLSVEYAFDSEAAMRTLEINGHGDQARPEGRRPNSIRTQG
jgi:hypothetical protein